jgi:hypothetical protein
MYLVAIVELLGNIDTPALKELAEGIGTTPYELRLLLNAGLPAVVLSTGDVRLAESVAAVVTQRGHRAILCDRRAAVPSAKMQQLRDFEFANDGLIADRARGDFCPFSDITVLLRATHRTTVQTIEQVKERQLRPVMALATGGLVLSKTTKKEVTSTTAQREQVLYIFRRSQPVPWLLRERTAHYAALGTTMAPSSLQNFSTTLNRLRSLAPQAKYDERLVTSRPIRGVADGIEATDLHANILAAALSGAAPETAAELTASGEPDRTPKNV